MKKFLSGCLCTLVLVGLIGTAAATVGRKTVEVDYNDIKVTLDGEPVALVDANGSAVEPFAISGTTYLPVRAVSSALGLEVNWNAATSTVELSSGQEQTAPSPDPTTSASISGTPTLGQQNALDRAESYLSFTAFSYTRLIEQLEFEGFTTEEATYAADRCGADWFEQAALKAQSYLDVSSFSRQGLIDQLEFEGFTPEQAEYGVTAVGY